MTLIRLKFCLISGILSWFCFAHSTAQAPLSYFHYLTTEGGLSQGNNSFVFQDSRGFVWLSSIDGLNRFDGLSVKVYRPNPNNKRALFGQNMQSPFFENANGDVWFCTYEAINCYHRKTDDFEHWQVPDALTGDTIREDYTAFFLQNGRLWLRLGDGDKGKAYVFDTKTGQATFNGQLLGNRFCVDTTSKGQLRGVYSFFYANKNRGLYQTKFDGNSTSLNSYELKPSSLFSNGLYGFLKEADSCLWVATAKGLIAYNLSNFEGKTYPLSIAGASSVKDLQPLTDTSFIVSSGKNGLFVFNKSKGQFESETHYKSGRPNALLNNALSELYLDNYRNLWVSHWGYGVSYVNLNKTKFRQISIDNIAPKILKMINSLAEDRKGQIWVSSLYGELFIFEKYRLTRRYFQNKGLPKENINQVFADFDKKIWVVTERNVFLYDEINDFFKPISLEIARLSMGKGALINQLRDGRLILSQSAIFGVKNDVGKNGYHLTKPDVHPLFDIKVSDYFQQVSNGTLFCNFNTAETTAILPDGTVKTLPFLNFVALYEDKTAPFYWFATTYGLVKLNKNDFTYTIYDESKGLPNQYIYAVLPDSKGFLWLSSNKGILRFDPKTETCRQYGVADGIKTNEFNTGAWLKASNGDIWFGNQDALNVFNPDQIQDVKNAPQIQITNLQINDRDWQSPQNIGEMRALRFPFTDNTLSLTFAALEYSDPANNQLFYKLEGYDRDWVSCRKGALGFARYPNLPAGNYQFKVKAVSSDGIEAEIKHPLSILIEKPWYQTWWFYAFMTALVSGILYGVYRYRLFQVLKMERLRNRISADLHDDIGATLSNVNILTTLVRQRLPNDVDVLPLLTRIEEEISTSSESLDDIIWSVNPKNDNMERVLSRMRQYANEVFDAKGIEGTLDFDPNLSNLSLPMDKRRDFYLIFKEALNNLSKYAQCKEATISLNQVDNKLKLVVSDNGIGFDPLSIKEGNGQKTMRQRAERLKAELVIESVVGKGTRVELSLPFL
jgi:ligand-binding sensor domain-containing protein/two-component sensor histidine kinase